MKSKLLLVVSILTMFTFVGCDKESLTEALIGENSITLSGDISKSYDAVALAGLSQEDTLKTFGLVIGLKESGKFSEQLILAKVSNELPAVGTYDVGLVTSQSESEGKFTGVYNVNDSKMYYSSSGTVKITKSSLSKIAGTFEIVCQYFSTTTGKADPNKTLKVKGKFSTIPVNLDL